MDSTVKTFLISRVTDQSLLQSKSTTENTIRVVIPFKDQVSANIVKTQLKDLSVKLQVNVQPVFTNRKIAHEFSTNEPKPQLIDQQCVDPYFSFQKPILFTIISTLFKNEQKINVGSSKNFKISAHGTWNPAILRLQGE